MTLRALIPNELAGKIIGKGGATINSLCQTSGTHVDLSKNNEASATHRIASVRGTPDACATACHLIALYLLADPREPSGYSADTPSLELLVPAAQCGWIIGKGGVRIKATRADTGCEVEISKETWQGTEDKVVSIAGASAGLQLALGSISIALTPRSPRE